MFQAMALAIKQLTHHAQLWEVEKQSSLRIPQKVAPVLGKRKHHTLNIDSQLGILLNRCQRRTKKWKAKGDKRGNQPVDFDREWLTQRYHDHQGVSAISPKSFTMSPERGPYQISLDRIDDSKGYTKNNVRFVCWVFNSVPKWTSTKFHFFQQKPGLQRRHTDPHISAWLQKGGLAPRKIQQFFNSLQNGVKHRNKKFKKQGRFGAQEMDTDHWEVNYLLDLYVRQKGRCAYSDLPIYPITNRPDWKVSVERLDPHKPYRKENIVLIAFEFNTSYQLNRHMVQAWRQGKQIS